MMHAIWEWVKVFALLLFVFWLLMVLINTGLIFMFDPQGKYGW